MADNALHIDTDGVLVAHLEKSDGTPLLRSECASLQLTINSRRTGYTQIATRALTVATVLDATSGDLTAPLLATEQIILISGKQEETHRVSVRGVLADGKKFVFWHDYKVANEGA